MSTSGGKPEAKTASGPAAKVCTQRNLRIRPATAARWAEELPQTTSASASRCASGTGAVES